MKVKLEIKDYWGLSKIDEIEKWKRNIESWGFKVKLGTCKDPDNRVRWHIEGTPIVDLNIKDVFQLEKDFGIFDLGYVNGEPTIELY